MKIVALKCPNCNADIELDQDREFGFCNYCGTKIMIGDAVQKVSGTVNISHISEINNILRRAKDYEKRGLLDEAEKYYDRVLDIDMDNQEAQDGLERVKTTILDPNVIIERPPVESSYAEQVVVSESGEEVCRLGIGERSCILCEIGRHILDFSTRDYKFKARVIISDRNDSAKIEVWYVRGSGLCASAEGCASIITNGVSDGNKEENSEKPSGCLIVAIAVCIFLFILGILISL